VAFSSAKGLDLEWCKACDRGLPAPDVIIYLDMPIEDAAQVIDNDVDDSGMVTMMIQ